MLGLEVTLHAVRNIEMKVEIMREKVLPWYMWGGERRSSLM